MKRRNVLTGAAVLALSTQPVQASPYVARVFMQFEDGSILSETFAKGSREACERAAQRPPRPMPPAGRIVIRSWVDVIRTPNAMGQE